MITKSIEQKFLANPGYIDVENCPGGLEKVWKWRGGPVAVVHDIHIQTVVKLAADKALPWEIKIIGKDGHLYYVKKGSEVPSWMERYLN